MRIRFSEITVTRRSLVALAVLSMFFLMYLVIESQDQDDFYIYLSGSRDLFNGENIYLKKYNEWYHYLYSVFFAMLIFPLTLLPFGMAKFLWLSANVVFLYRIFEIIFSWVDETLIGPEMRKWFMLVSALCCIRFINDNFHCGQITILLLYFCLQGIVWIWSGKNWQGALLIALGTNIKIMPVVMIPYLFYRRHFLAGFLTIGFVIAFYLFPSLLIGHGRNLELVQTWWGMMNPSNTEHVVDVYDRSFHSLSTFFSVYFYNVEPDPYGYGTKINIMDLSLQQLSWLINGARVALIIFTLYFLRAPAAGKNLSKEARWRELAYILAVVPLIFPHQHHYAFVFFLPAFIYLLYRYFGSAMFSGFKRPMLWGLITVFLCFNLQLFLGEFREIYEHFKIITFGALICLGMMVSARDENFQGKNSLF